MAQDLKQTTATTPTDTTTQQTQSITEKLNNAMQQVDETLKQEAEQKKQELANQTTTQAPQKPSTADEQRLQQVYTDMQNALNTNANFIIKTDLSLRGVIELVAIMRLLNNFYLYHAELLKDNKTEIQNAIIDIETMNKRFNEMVTLANTYIMQSLKEMDNTSGTILDLRNEIEQLHDTTLENLSEVIATGKQVKITYEKLQLLENKFGNLDTTLEELERLSANNDKVLQDMKNFLTVELNNAIAQLMLKKEEYERDLQANFTTLQTQFNEVLSNLQNEGQELINQSGQIKTDTINEINIIAKTRLQEIRNLDSQVSTSLNALKTDALTEIQAKHSQALQEIQKKVELLQSESNTKKEQFLREIETKATEKLNEIDTTAQNSINEINTKKAEITTQANKAISDIQTEASTHTTQLQTALQDKITELNNTATLKLTEIENKKQELTDTADAGLESIRNEAQTHTQQLQTELANSLNEIDTKGQEKVTEIETTAQDKITEITTNTSNLTNDLTTKQNELEQKINEHTNALNVNKNEVTEAIRAIKETSLQELRTAQQRAEEAIAQQTTGLSDNVRQEFTNQITAITNKGNEKLAEINTATQGLTDLTNTKKAEITTQGNEKLAELQVMKQDYTNTATQSLTALNSKVTENQSIMERERDDSLNMLRATLTTIFKGFKHVNFNANSTFTIPQNVRNVYVNVIGGTGQNRRSTAGTPSSFGNYLTATGGAGNAGGNGQFGFSRFALITLRENESSVNISVGAGGSVDVFYTQEITEAPAPITPPQNPTAQNNSNLKNIEMGGQAWINANIANATSEEASYLYTISLLYANMVRIVSDLSSVEITRPDSAKIAELQNIYNMYKNDSATLPTLKHYIAGIYGILANYLMVYPLYANKDQTHYDNLCNQLLIQQDLTVNTYTFKDALKNMSIADFSDSILDYMKELQGIITRTKA